ncbi:ribulokinase [Sphingobacterium chuzhouense]|uniref:Ribulokinase n=1 Tax=Sphingobacterium chuzhouense TaxID=1742264 RepID=A0ABR7XP38_9SPHI|nr:ribulokinase [Sphingobacterium chuzhouense]MBD1420941.1 ribulokinase [Sphingobacterium chuzhouense]
MNNNLVIGMDFGTDSARGILANPHTGEILSKSVSYFKRWEQGLYCDPAKDQYRQHPLDYIESIDEVFTELLANLTGDDRKRITAIGTNTTGSTPVAVDKSGKPLPLQEEFQDNPHAMFILWKDHTAVREAEEINALAKKWPVDFTAYSGGIYSSEWFWSKILYTNRRNKRVLECAYSWMEQSDWIPAYLAGADRLENVKRNRCAAGHKAMWAEEHGGLPSAEFLCSLDPTFYHLVNKMYRETFTSNEVLGSISPYFVNKFGFSEDTLIAVGGIDAHHGAVGAGIKPSTFVKVIGTSTCDMYTLPKQADIPLIQGICGQVDGSIVPGTVGFEAGQSAFGDIYHWFKKLLLEPTVSVLADTLSREQKNLLNEKLLSHLSQSAELLPLTENDLIFTDYHNGRRTPDADFTVLASAHGFSLSTTAAHIFKALVEATAFGSKAIMERFKESNTPIERVLATGGVATRSPYVIQVLADILNMPIDVVDNDQTCALGAVIFASVAAGIYPDVVEAQKQLAADVVRTFSPIPKQVAIYEQRYRKYQVLTKTNLFVS